MRGKEIEILGDTERSKVRSLKKSLRLGFQAWHLEFGPAIGT